MKSFDLKVDFLIFKVFFLFTLPFLWIQDPGQGIVDKTSINILSLKGKDESLVDKGGSHSGQASVCGPLVDRDGPPQPPQAISSLTTRGGEGKSTFSLSF